MCCLPEGPSLPRIAGHWNQVTSKSEQFYREHLSDRPMQPLKGLVHVVGAAGQEVPFLGYVELSISFPRTEAGTKFSRCLC